MLGEVVESPIRKGNAEFLLQGTEALGVVGIVAEQQHLPALAVLDQPRLIFDVDVVAPVEPVVEAFPGQDDSRLGGVAEPHDRTGVQGRSRTGGCSLVDAQYPPPTPCEFQCRGCADDADADDDRVVAVGVAGTD